MEPPNQSQWQKVDNKQYPLTVADSAGKGKTSEAPPPPLKAWYLLGPRWGGFQDNEPYGGISITTQKSENEKIRISNAWSIEKCATPKRYLHIGLSAPQNYELMPLLTTDRFGFFSHRFVVWRFCTSRQFFGYSAMKNQFYFLYPKINPLRWIYF